MSIDAQPHDDHTHDDASDSAAARLLEMTARETDRWRAEAKDEAAAVVAGGHDEAAGLVRTAREEADRLVAAAREEAARILDDARVEARRAHDEAVAARAHHEEDVARLERLASDHREHLRRHLTQMLDQVDAPPGSTGQ